MEESATYLGFDPGSRRCGLAVVNTQKAVLWRAVVGVVQALSEAQRVSALHRVTGIVLGNQTGSRDWQNRFQGALPQLPIHVVDERYSSQEARLRYWDFYPAGWQALLPRSLRVPSGAYDDVVAVILVERFLAQRP